MATQAGDRSTQARYNRRCSCSGAALQHGWLPFNWLVQRFGVILSENIVPVKIDELEHLRLSVSIRIQNRASRIITVALFSCRPYATIAVRGLSNSSDIR